MKILKIILISVFGLVLILILAAVVFVKTFDINRYKPQIIEQASRALRRPVDFQKAELGISWTQGISLKVSRLAILKTLCSGEVLSLLLKMFLWALMFLLFFGRKKFSSRIFL